MSIKIGLLSIEKPRSKRAWSGILFYMGQSLEREGFDVGYIGPLPLLYRTTVRILQRVKTMFTGKKHLTFLNETLARLAGTWFSKQKLNSYDVLFVPVGSTIIPYLDSNTPIFYLNDTTFHQIHTYYDWFSNMHPSEITKAEQLEVVTLAKAEWISFSSNWAAKVACEHYHVSEDKIVIAPYGANLSHVPDSKKAIESKKMRKTCNLLFLGVNWERKGGEIALDTYYYLMKEMGLDVTITLCGSAPPDVKKLDEGVKIIPFLDKTNSDDELKIHTLLLEAHFLILPTRADCTPVVFSEAAAFALPVITTNTGGVADIVRDGENGWALPVEADAAHYAKKIASIWQETDVYQQLVITSRDMYEKRLNWQTWGNAIANAIRQSEKINV